MRIGLLIVPRLLSGNHAMFTVQLLQRFFMNARTKTPTDASFDVYTTMTANSQVTTTGPTEWALTEETVLVPAVAVDFTCDAWQEFTQRRNEEAEYWSVNAADNSNAQVRGRARHVDETTAPDALASNVASVLNELD